jgi:polyhydroxybutyrate depolymerase
MEKFTHEKRFSAVLAALALTILAGCTLSNPRPTSHPVFTPAASGNQKLSLVVGSLTREYVVHVPPQYDGRTPLPVVIMFHGGGGNDTQVLSATGWN